MKKRMLVLLFLCASVGGARGMEGDFSPHMLTSEQERSIVEYSQQNPMPEGVDRHLCALFRDSTSNQLRIIMFRIGQSSCARPLAFAMILPPMPKEIGINVRGADQVIERSNGRRFVRRFYTVRDKEAAIAFVSQAEAWKNSVFTELDENGVRVDAHNTYVCFPKETLGCGFKVALLKYISPTSGRVSNMQCLSRLFYARSIKEFVEANNLGAWIYPVEKHLFRLPGTEDQRLSDDNSVVVFEVITPSDRRTFSQHGSDVKRDDVEAYKYFWAALSVIIRCGLWNVDASNACWTEHDGRERIAFIDTELPAGGGHDPDLGAVPSDVEKYNGSDNGIRTFLRMCSLPEMTPELSIALRNAAKDMGIFSCAVCMKIFRDQRVFEQ